jgi:hypothetical protein
LTPISIREKGNTGTIMRLRKKELLPDFRRGAKIKGIYYAKTVLRVKQ